MFSEYKNLYYSKQKNSKKKEMFNSISYVHKNAAVIVYVCIFFAKSFSSHFMLHDTCICISIILFASFSEHKHTYTHRENHKQCKNKEFCIWNGIMVYFGGPVKWIYRAEWRNFPRQTVFVWQRIFSENF